MKWNVSVIGIGRCNGYVDLEIEAETEEEARKRAIDEARKRNHYTQDDSGIAWDNEPWSVDSACPVD